MIVAHENKSESLQGAKLADDVERVIVAIENKRESFREAILAANVERVIMKVNHCVKRDKRLM